jgi:hypothetical protein
MRMLGPDGVMANTVLPLAGLWVPSPAYATLTVYDPTVEVEKVDSESVPINRELDVQAPPFIVQTTVPLGVDPPVMVTVQFESCEPYVSGFGEQETDTVGVVLTMAVKATVGD